jgi:hypothetical protein
MFQFNNMLGNAPCSLVFEGKDLRLERLVDRKQELRRLLNRALADARLGYVDYVDGRGIQLFQLFRHACR